MQKILILISLLLYGVGCGTSNGKSTEKSLTSLSNEINIIAHSERKHVAVMEISALYLEGVALDIAISEDGNFVYIASGDAGLNVVDIHDPYNPKMIGNYDTLQYVNNVEVINGTAYVSYKAQTWSDYVAVSAFDISDPYRVEIVESYESFQNNNHKSCTQNGLIYQVDQEGFKIISESGYKVVGRFDLFDTAYAFVLRENIVFIANGRNGLTVLKAGESDYTAKLTNP